MEEEVAAAPGAIRGTSSVAELLAETFVTSSSAEVAEEVEVVVTREEEEEVVEELEDCLR